MKLDDYVSNLVHADYLKNGKIDYFDVLAKVKELYHNSNSSTDMHILTSIRKVEKRLTSN